MKDPLSKRERSARMALIRSSDTKPEFVVRRMVSALGYRYRLHCSGLPGKPDLVLRPHGKIIFVHGCFWHQHGTKTCPPRRPKSNKAYWHPKLQQNKKRDQKVARLLRKDGWKLLTVWECEVRNPIKLEGKLARFLSG